MDGAGGATRALQQQHGEEAEGEREDLLADDAWWVERPSLQAKHLLSIGTTPGWIYMNTTESSCWCQGMTITH